MAALAVWMANTGDNEVREERKLCSNCRTATTCLELGCGQSPRAPSPASDAELPPLPKVGPICYAMAADVMAYRVPRVGKHLPGVYDVALWSTDQMHAYVRADRAASTRTASDTRTAAGAGVLTLGEEPTPCARLDSGSCGCSAFCCNYFKRKGA